MSKCGVSEHMLLFCDNSDEHDKKGGVCRVSELVNKSWSATEQFLEYDTELEMEGTYCRIGLSGAHRYLSHTAY